MRVWNEYDNDSTIIESIGCNYVTNPYLLTTAVFSLAINENNVTVANSSKSRLRCQCSRTCRSRGLSVGEAERDSIVAIIDQNGSGTKFYVLL